MLVSLSRRVQTIASSHTSGLSRYCANSIMLIISQMLRYGCTRLEIGVQSVYEDVARDTNRGHTVRAVSESFHMAKDAGYKIVAHMMPDLPNCGTERDIWQFQEFFENPAFRSDGLKLYPTLVIRGTGKCPIACTFWSSFLASAMKVLAHSQACMNSGEPENTRTTLRMPW